MSTFQSAVVVMGKLPKPGRVKTRLQLPGEIAAELYTAFLKDVFDIANQALAKCPGQGTFACDVRAGDSLAEAEALVPSGWRVVRQVGADLGERMRHAWRCGDAAQTVVVGSDLPTLPVSRVTEALRYLSEVANQRASVFVPAEDGGYVLVGMTHDFPELYEGISWSTSSVMADTQVAAANANILLKKLDPHYDVDKRQDLERLGRELSPDTYTARVLSKAFHL